jgi:hypothetical protein
MAGHSTCPDTDPLRSRYLRARRFVPLEAFKQFKDTEDWRKEHEIDNLFLTIEIEEFERTRRLVPSPTLHQ